MALVAITAFAPGAIRAQDATWRLNPPILGNFNSAANWDPTTVPTGTAFFGMSNRTELTFSAPTTVGGWTFNAGASAYTFANTQPLSFNGAGIVISGGSATINNNAGGDLDFTNNSTAGNATIHNTRIIDFFDSSTGGSAAINNDGGSLTFRDTSSAGTAIIINNVGSLNFRNASTAGNATITNNAVGNEVIFFDNSTGGKAAITNASGAVVDFSFSTGPAGDHKLTAGSIAGAGLFQLGANELTVGGNNLSTDVSGIILGTGSLVKVGAGTLTLSGSANLGGTTIDGGTLAVRGGTLNIDAGGGATTQNLIVGLGGVGTLAVQNGGTLTDFGGFIGNLPGSQGTATVSGANSTWTNTDTIVVGGLGAGTLSIQDGGTVNGGGGGSIGLAAGSTGTVTVTGPGSIWNNSPGLNVGAFGAGALTIANGGAVINNSAFPTNIGEGAGSLGTVTVTARAPPGATVRG